MSVRTLTEIENVPPTLSLVPIETRFKEMLREMERAGFFTEEREALHGLSERLLNEEQRARACCWLSACVLPAVKERYMGNGAILDQIEGFQGKISSLLQFMPNARELLKLTQEFGAIQRLLSELEERFERLLTALATAIDEKMAENLASLQEQLLSIHTEKQEEITRVEELKAKIYRVAGELLAKAQENTQIEERANHLQETERQLLLKILKETKK